MITENKIKQRAFVADKIGAEAEAYGDQRWIELAKVIGWRNPTSSTALYDIACVCVFRWVGVMPHNAVVKQVLG